MKKLLVIIAAALATIVASAASTDWKVQAGNIYNSSGDKYTGDILVYCVGIGDGGKDVQVATASVNNGVAGYSFSSTMFTAESTYDFYFTLTDNGKMYTSPTKTGVKALGTGTATIGFGNMSATQTATNWTTVPEPTSALLMVLGVAGLALRRRRV